MWARIADLLLKLLGWRRVGEFPADLKKYVLIAAPHTSNWDGVLFVMMKIAWKLEITWMVKADIVKGPWGWFIRRLGGLPVDRTKANGLVESAVAMFKQSERLIVGVPPEGTRGYREYWKSGFYHIARGAGVPLVLAFLDYRTKTGGFGRILELTGDVKKDMDAIRAFYADKIGKFPELMSRIRLREEDALVAATA